MLTTRLNVIFPFQICWTNATFRTCGVDDDDDNDESLVTHFFKLFVGGQKISLTLCRGCLAKLTTFGLEMSLREPQFAQILPRDVGFGDSSHHKQIIGYCTINICYQICTNMYKLELVHIKPAASIRSPKYVSRIIFVSYDDKTGHTQASFSESLFKIKLC